MGFKKISEETREYFWFALALMLILIGARARADTPVVNAPVVSSL